MTACSSGGGDRTGLDSEFQLSQIQDINTTGASSNPNQFVEVGSLKFFVADDDSHGKELWVSDGTAGGTHMVKDIKPGHEGSSPYNLTMVDTGAGEVLVFSADDGDNGGNYGAVTVPRLERTWPWKLIPVPLALISIA